MKKYNLEENRIHPYLSYYAYHFLDVYTKSVSYSIKDMSNYTYWFQPNVVGINYAFEKDEVTDDIEKELGTNIKLYSFKIRRSVGFHN
ncbi:MAG: hypothetical protein ACOCV8_06110, partial [Spirochaetota bacterium]